MILILKGSNSVFCFLFDIFQSKFFFNAMGDMNAKEPYGGVFALFIISIISSTHKETHQETQGQEFLIMRWGSPVT